MVVWFEILAFFVKTKTTSDGSHYPRRSDVMGCDGKKGIEIASPTAVLTRTR